MWPFKCDHSNKSYWAVLTRGAICFSKFYKIKFANLHEICLWLHLAVTVKTPSQPIICRTGPSCSKAGYHVFLDKSLANTEHNKKNDYPDTCSGHSDLSGGYH